MGGRHSIVPIGVFRRSFRKQLKDIELSSETIMCACVRVCVSHATCCQGAVAQGAVAQGAVAQGAVGKCWAGVLLNLGRVLLRALAGPNAVLLQGAVAGCCCRVLLQAAVAGCRCWAFLQGFFAGLFAGRFCPGFCWTVLSHRDFWRVLQHSRLLRVLCKYNNSY